MKIRKYKLIIFLFFVCFRLSSQTISDSSSFIISADGFYNINSNNLTNKLYSTVYSGGFIDEDLKAKQFKNLRNCNRVGGDAGINLNFALRLKNKKNNINYLGFTLAQKYHYRAKFSDDLLKLILSGNANFIGSSAYFNQTSINYLNYQQLQIHYTTIRKNDMFKIGVSYLKGVDFLDVKIKNGELYTKSDLTQLFLNTSYTINLPDTSAKKRFNDFNGQGVALNLNYTATISSGTQSNTYLNVSLADLGLLVWKNAYSAKVDTSFNFGGIQLNNIFQLNDSNLTGISADSIKNNFLPFRKNQIQTMLPAWLELSFKTINYRNSSISYGIKYRIFADYNLFGFVAINRQLGKKINTGLSFSYGGYGRYNLGWELKALPFKNAELAVQTNNLFSFILPSSTFGQGLSVAMRYGF